MLRDAFTKTMNDPGIFGRGEEEKLDVDPTSGEEVQALVKDVMNQPKDVIERLNTLMGK